MLVIIRYGLLATLLCICSWTDWKRRTISLPVLGIFAAGGLVLQIAEDNVSSWNFCLAFCPGILCLIVSAITGQALGYGDSCLILCLGAFVSIEEIFCVCKTAVFLCGIAAVVLVVGFHRKRKDTIPFAPFLLAGYLVELIPKGG